MYNHQKKEIGDDYELEVVEPSPLPSVKAEELIENFISEIENP